MSALWWIGMLITFSILLVLLGVHQELELRRAMREAREINND